MISYIHHEIILFLFQIKINIEKINIINSIQIFIIINRNYFFKTNIRDLYHHNNY
jgi:hypothetical protein